MTFAHDAHAHIVTALTAAAGTANRDQATDSYTGSTHLFYAVPVPTRRQIVRLLLRAHPHQSPHEWLSLADQLFRGASHEEKTMGAMILQYHRAARVRVTRRQLRRWLAELVGWAEVDALCYNIFTAEELLADWEHWEQFLCTCRRSRNTNVRRAALVLLCGPVTRSSDARLHACAFGLVKSLSSESALLITKAISWLLRCQVDTQKDAVRTFMSMHSDDVPRFVMREVTRKIVTGKKN